LKDFPFEDSSVPLGTGYSLDVTAAPTPLQTFATCRARFQWRRKTSSCLQPPIRDTPSPRAPRPNSRAPLREKLTPLLTTPERPSVQTLEEPPQVKRPPDFEVFNPSKVRHPLASKGAAPPLTFLL
jgi:hypothetical protein